MNAPTVHTPPATEEQFGAERAAVERLLATGVFDRSPNLAVFLRYVCNRYFEGKAADIKEYNIAVEALGRSAEFDQKRDAIVRVEAHRLRKRLQQYYETKGAADPIQVLIPSGSYAPVFVYQSVELSPPERQIEPRLPAVELPMVQEAPPEPPGIAPARPPVGRLPILIVFALIGAALAFGLVYWTRGVGADSRARVQVPIVAPGPLDEVRILAGSTSPKYVDHFGNQWGPDRYFTGGDAVAVSPRTIQRTHDAPLYLNRRQGDFKYDIPLRAGSYELRLHFAETMFGDNNIAGGGEASRIFNIRLNGEFLLLGWDALSDAYGSNIANIRVFRDVRPASDGYLHLHFEPTLKETAFVNAIELVPAAPGGALHPVRIVARSSSYTDSKKLEWLSDRFYLGGQAVQRFDEIAGTSDGALYQSERYGNFSYAIPVAEGSRYTATLRFSEHWFGPGRPGGGGAGERIFDVYVNGRTLLDKFDVFKAAGGALRPVDRTFRGLQPNAQGKLIFQFVPVRNYASINGIEIVEEGR
jgi:hypothetical protein